MDRDIWSGLTAGSPLAFNTQLLTRLSHLQILHLFWLPLAILALDVFIAERRPRHAVAVGACVLGAVLTSGYLGMFVTTALVAALLVRKDGWWGHGRIRTLMPLAAAAAVTLLVAVVILWPYQELRREQGFVRPLGDVPTSLSAASGNYLSTAARIHHATWSAAYYDAAAESLFPGVVALGLAGIALCTRRRVAPLGVRRMLVSIGMGGFVMSLGPATPVYIWAYRLLPPLQGLRAVERFGILVVFAVAALAGLGLARLRRQLPGRWRNPLAVAVLALVTLEAFHGPIPYDRTEQSPRIYQSLEAERQSGAVAELPIYSGDLLPLNGPYMVASTAHWRPLINGFSGFQPPGFHDLAQVVGTFPSVVSLARLRALGVRHVVVHTASYSRPDAIRQRLARLDDPTGVVLVASAGPDVLYRLDDTAPTTVERMLGGLEWSALTFADGPQAPGSVLRQVDSLGTTFALQSPQQVVAYMEETNERSRLVVRLPNDMTGEFLDAGTGAVLGRVSVRAGAADQPPTPLIVPSPHDAVLLVLTGTDTS